MNNKMMNLAQFVDTAVSEKLQESIVGGLNIRPYMNDNYEVEIYGGGPYTTYIDGIRESDNDTW